MPYRVVFAALLAALPVAGASAAVTVTIHADVATGQAAFGASADVFNYRNLFNDSAFWTLGSYGGSSLNSQTMVDTVTMAVLSTAQPVLSVTNWIDGPGFDNGAAAAPDLAVSGHETFTLQMAAPIQRLGFAISVGTGLLPSEVDLSGLTGIFALTVFNGASSVGGSLEAFPNPSGGAAYWVDIQSETPFDRVFFQDVNASLADEYFGDFVSGSLPASVAVPEPQSWALLIAGFGLVGAALRRRRRAALI